MSRIAILCVDGSERSVAAVAEGLAVLDPSLEPLVVTVMDMPDRSLVTGGGFAGGAMTEEEFEASEQAIAVDAKEAVSSAAATLGLAGTATEVLVGHPGAAICQLAAERSAGAVVMGSRGRGGFKRAVLGSVSDHVVRNAPCPVVVTGWAEDSD